MVLDLCFKKYDYKCDNLAASCTWFQLGRVIPLDLDGAAPMERPPLGGGGYQRDVNSLINNALRFILSQEKIVIR